MYITKKVSELTAVERRACYNAHMGAAGFMREELIRKDGGDSIVIMDWEGPRDSARGLRAWALLTPITKSFHAIMNAYARRTCKYSVLIWVKKPYRRQGVGSELVKQVKQHDPKPYVFPHDEASSQLYSKFRVYADRHARTMLRNKPKLA